MTPVVRAVGFVVACAVSIGCGRSTRAPQGALRVVSLSPSTTETLFAIGAGSALVGRSRYCDYPPEAKTVPVVGGFVDANLETILALKPSLVTSARGPAGASIAAKLQAHDVATYFPPADSIADVFALIDVLGQKTAHEGAAHRLVAAIGDRLAQIDQRTKTRSRPRVLLVFGLQPIVVAGPHTFADEMLSRAGGDNVVRDGPGYPTIGLERVIALDPDVVLSATGDSEQRVPVEASGWKELRAVRLGRAVTIDDEAVLRPGPRIADGIETLERAISGLPTTSAR